jgi:predicted ATPase
MKPLLMRRFFAGLAAALVGGVGLFTLGAWVLDLWHLVAMGTSYIPMAPITALVFVFLAAALAGRLWLAGRRSVTWAIRAGMGCALAIAGAELVRTA